MIDKEMRIRLYIILGLLVAILVLVGVRFQQKAKLTDSSGEDVLVLQPVEDFLKGFTDKNFEECGLVEPEITSNDNYLNNKMYETSLSQVVDLIDSIEVVSKEATHYKVKVTIYNSIYTEPEKLVESIKGLNQKYLDEEIEIEEYHVRFTDLIISNYKTALTRGTEKKEIEFNLRSSQSGVVLNKNEFVALLLDKTGVRENTLKFQEVYNLKIDEVIEDVRKEAE